MTAAAHDGAEADGDATRDRLLLQQVGALRTEAEAVVEDALLSMFEATDAVRGAGEALAALTALVSPEGVQRLREIHAIFDGLIQSVSSSAATHHAHAGRLDHRLHSARGHLDDLGRTAQEAAYLSLNAMIVSRSVPGLRDALGIKVQEMRDALGEFDGILAEFEPCLVTGLSTLGDIRRREATLVRLAEGEAVASLRAFAARLESQAGNRALARAALRVAPRLTAMERHLDRVIFQLQSADSLRQRLEHAETLLAAADRRREMGRDREGLLIRHLARAQVRGAVTDALVSIGGACSGLSRLRQGGADVAGLIGDEALEAALHRGLTSLADDSTRLATLVRDLDECDVGLADGSVALAAALGPIAQARGRVTAFEQRIRHVGLNTILLSSRIGAEGRAMSEVARQLHEMAYRVTTVVGHLQEDIRAIGTSAEGMRANGGPSATTRLLQAMAAASEFGAVGRRVESALQVLGTVSRPTAVAPRFDRASQSLVAFGVRVRDLGRAASVPSHPAPVPDAGLLVDLDALADVYSMEAERAVHSATTAPWRARSADNAAPLARAS